MNTILFLAILIIMVGFVIPQPPGVLGALLYEWMFRKRLKRQRERKMEIRKIIDALHDGGILSEEIKKAERGESKYFRKL